MAEEALEVAGNLGGERLDERLVDGVAGGDKMVVEHGDGAGSTVFGGEGFACGFGARLLGDQRQKLHHRGGFHLAAKDMQAIGDQRAGFAQTHARGCGVAGPSARAAGQM